MRQDIVTEAYNDLMTRMFGVVPQHPEEYSVSREEYVQHMEAIQEIYGLTHGHPKFLEFMLTLAGRSPIIYTKGENANGTTTKPTNAE